MGVAWGRGMGGFYASGGDWGMGGGWMRGQSYRKTRNGEKQNMRKSGGDGEKGARSNIKN